jgi:hypothetical protein
MGRGGGNLPNGQAGGFLGKAYDPFSLMADPSQENFEVPDLLPPASIPPARLDRRRRLREAVEESTRNSPMSQLSSRTPAKADGQRSKASNRESRHLS